MGWALAAEAKATIRRAIRNGIGAGGMKLACGNDDPS
jgi:hypothetical protein